jgi:hypothetical protein
MRETSLPITPRSCTSVSHLLVEELTNRDPSGSLKFRKAVVTSQGVKFEDGASFDINMDEMDIVGELGKGNYGSVQQVFHRPTNIMMAMKVSMVWSSLNPELTERKSDWS